MKTLKILTAAFVLAMGASFATAASADTFAAGASFKATPVQYDGRYRDHDRGRDHDRYRDRDHRWERNHYRDGRDYRGGYYGGGYYRSRYRAWDWDGDGVPNRYDSRPRNPRRS